MWTRFRHWWLALRLLPGLVFDVRRRALFYEIRAFERALPTALKNPLPDALRSLTPPALPHVVRNDSLLRDLSDLVALLDRRSPLGLCLRRSLTRYHFLRRAGWPVVLHFGARFVEGRPDRNVTGHAWLTLNDTPYYEADENWQGFTVMLRWPEAV